MAYNNVKVKTRQVVTQSTQTQTLGITTNVPMGDWQPNVEYQKLNMVRSHEATYQAKKQNVGVEPTITSGWQEVWQIVAYDGRGVVSSSISYQASISNTEVPSGEWSDEIPNVPQGQYLWTRTIYTFTDGSQNISYSVSLQGLNFTQQDRDNLDKIVDAFPSSASKNNLLATQDFVNSSINNMAAFYITYNANGDAFPTRATLISATTFYQGGQTRVPTQNDYAIVLSDESQPKGVDGNYPTTRYSYQGGTYPNGQWDFQYVVNNTSLTQAQVDAINSGITKELVDQFSENTVIPAKNLYNLGVYESYVSNGDGTATITRKTGYLKLDGSENWLAWTTSNSTKFRWRFESGITDSKTDATNTINCKANTKVVTTDQTWSLVDGFSFYNKNFYFYLAAYSSQSDRDAFLTYLSKNPIYVQYELANSYTEQVIENQPIRPANQEENYYWHEEWRKGLNYFNASLFSTTERRLSLLNLKVGETYTIAPPTGHSIKISVDWFSADDSDSVIKDIDSQPVDGRATSYTFIYNTDNDWKIFIDPGDNQGNEDLAIYQIMLVKGAHIYPYEPYCGEILREKDIEKIDGSQYVKKSGDTMTGLLKAYGGLSLNDRTPNFDTTIPYFLGITDWGQGGVVKYRTRAQVIDDLGIDLKYGPNNPQPSADYPTGFKARITDAGWGNQIGTLVTSWTATHNSDVQWRYDNPTEGKLSMIIDGTVYVGEGLNEVYSPINKPTPQDVGAVPVYVISGTGAENRYCTFARTSNNNPTGNVGATFLISGGGNFGGTITGTWLVEITNRGSTPTMTVTTLQANNNGTVAFGYRQNGSYFEFGMFTAEYRSLIYINVLKNTSVEIQTSFYDSPTAPSGWTTVKNRVLISNEDITLNGKNTNTPNFYAPTTTESDPRYHLMSNSDGVPIWVNASENYRLYTSSSLSTGQKQMNSLFQAYFKKGYTWMIICAKPDDTDAYIYYALPYSLCTTNSIIFKASTTKDNKYLTISFPPSGSTEVSLVEIINFNGFNALGIYMCKI